ncbi:hypothetical protein BGW41_002308 [Actinomortierella wolfii]|nr:hypothetical protein BGW41_002308 [Actinomortierella wolfii]
MVFFQLVRLQKGVSTSPGSSSSETTIAELTPAAHEVLAGLTDPLVPISIVIQHQSDWVPILAAIDIQESLDGSALAASPWHTHSLPEEAGVWAYLPSDGFDAHDDNKEGDAGIVAQPCENHAEDATHQQNEDQSLLDTLLRWTVLCSSWCHVVVPGPLQLRELTAFENILFGRFLTIAATPLNTH